MPKRTPEEEKIAKIIRDRLWQVLQEKGWTRQKHIAEDTGLSQQAISRWINGDLPTYPNLIRLAEGLGTSVDWLLGQTEVFDKPPNAPIQVTAGNANEYVRWREEIVVATQTHLWMQFRIGSDLHNLNADIFEVFRNPTLEEVRILLPRPDKDNPSIEPLAKSRRLGRTPEATIDDIRKTTRILKEIADDSPIEGMADRLHFHYIDRLPTYLAYIVDPCSENGRVFVVPSSYRGEYFKSPVTRIWKRSNNTVFDFYVKEFKRLWGAEEEFPC